MNLFWGNTDPSLIDDKMCKSYADQRKASPATVRYELLMVSTAIGWARKQGQVAAKPEMWLPQIGERKTRHLTHRSEEHTSELQSLMRISYAVFCLKKKQKK